MLKPNLQKSALPSTAISKNLLSARYLPLNTTSLKPGMREPTHPMISSFYKGSMRREQTVMIRKIVPPVPKESYLGQDIAWVNTSDIQSAIRRRIESDAELSIERNFATQKYFLGPERICTQRILPIPAQIRQLLPDPSQPQRESQRIHSVYGYLASLNAVYYIIGQDLFIFSIDDLRRRQQKIEQGKNQTYRIYKRTKVRPNCRKIYEVNFPLSHSSKFIPKQFQGKVLVLEYPYEIQLCCYLVDSRNQQEKKKSEQEQREREREREKDRDFVTLVSLDARIPLETASAQFITATRKGQLLYLDEKGHVVCFQFTKKDDHKLKRKTHQENNWKKKTFVSRNKGFIQSAKNYFWQILDFRHSLCLPKKKNLAMIYDEKRNRIYTLTIRGDRATIVQQLKKEVKVYEFVNKEKVQLNCIWSISEEELLVEIGIQPEKSPTRLFSIFKAEADYNQESDLIALLSNGTKVHLQVDQEKLKVSWVSISPDLQSIKRANQQRRQNLVEISNNYMPNDTNNHIFRKWNQKHEIRRSINGDARVKAFFNNRSFSIDLVKTQKEITMFMTSRKSTKNNDQYDVFPVEWKKSPIFSDIQNFPIENEIFMASDPSRQSLASHELMKLQKAEYLHQHDNRQKPHHKSPCQMTPNCHELLRQIHHGPHSFAYLTNKFITSFSLLRPIDILYLMVKTREQIFCELYLPAILATQPFEICCMLLQLYSAKKERYYVSMNYKLRMNKIIEMIIDNTHRYQTVSGKSILSKMSTVESSSSREKRIFQQKKEDSIQTHFEIQQPQTKLKIRRLFITFSRLQQIRDPNPFDKIKLNFQINSTSSQVQDNIDKLSQQKKCQAQYCLLYISRVVYPFWKGRILSGEMSKQLLKVVYDKLSDLFSLVDFLKMVGNDYWSHLKNFLTKLMQIAIMFQMISLLPQTLTLQQAVSKEPAYFQPYIFATLRRQTNPQAIKLFQDRFPIYISRYFQTLVKIFMEARLTSNIEQIKALLGRLTEYPDYFLDFLKEEKGFKDLTFLKIKDQRAYPTTTLNVPDLPFSSLVQYLHSRVKNTSVQMSQKLLYLKEVRKRMDLYKSPQCKQKEVFSPYVLQRLQKQYDTLFKCLKLQQECKNQITRVIEESIEQKESSNRQNGGFLNNILSKLSFSSSSSSQNSQQNQPKRLSLVSQKEKQRIYQGNQQMFNKLNYMALNIQDLKSLISEIDCPRLIILHCSMFSGRGINEEQRQQFRTKLFMSYCDIVNDGVKKFNVETGQNVYNKERVSQLVGYIRAQVKEIYMFLNMTHTPLAFSPLYQGIRHQMMKHQFTLKEIFENNTDCIFSTARQLVELGFDKNIALNHIILENLSKIFKQEDLERQDPNENLVKAWIYDWFMAVDVAKRYKPDQLDQLLQLNKEILEFKSTTFQTLVQQKIFLENGRQCLFNLINGQPENDLERRTVFEKIISSLK